jgi:hypothetical protein
MSIFPPCNSSPTDIKCVGNVSLVFIIFTVEDILVCMDVEENSSHQIFEMC